MRLLKKELDLEGCETLYHRAFSEQMLRVGFEAYCSYLKFTDFSIKRLVCREVEEAYQPEF